MQGFPNIGKDYFDFALEIAEQMNEKDKSTIKDIIDAFIKRSKLHQIVLA